MQVVIRTLCAADEGPFLAAVARSEALFAQWVSPPDTDDKFAEHLCKSSTDSSRCYLAWTAPDDLVGCINISQIVRGAFQSAYLGYYAFAPHNGKGFMKRALGAIITLAFADLKLHRLEANIQPANVASIGLVKSLGFRLEGFSPRYLKIAGAWRDHERYAITAEEWAPQRYVPFQRV